MRDDHHLKFCAGSFLPLLYLVSASVVLSYFHSLSHNQLLPTSGTVLLLGLETDVFPIVKEHMISQRRQRAKCACLLFDY